MALLVVLALVVVGGCSSGSGTPTPDDAGDASRSPSASRSTSGAPARTDSPVRWQPEALPWHIQYTGTLVVPAGTRIVDLDGADTSAAEVARLGRAGIKAICYLNAGAHEDWRGDAAAFPRAAIGAPMAGWPERWLDIRRADVLAVVTARIDECADKGFVAVDPDNVDGWQAETGWALTADDEVRFIRALAEHAHSRGLAMGLKNAPELIPRLLDVVDFAVNESCLARSECGLYAPAVAAGIPVFHIEYDATPAQVCGRAPAGFVTVIAEPELGPRQVRCP